LGKAIFGGQLLNFLDDSQQTKKEKKYFLYLLHKNGIHSIQQDEWPKIRVFKNNYWMGRVWQSNFE